MTSLRFIGDFPVWAGVLLALGISLVVWRYYQRERHDMPEGLRRWLPVLRAVAVFLAVMTLTGPVLHHRQVTGQLGRVLVFLDASQSMGAKDQHVPIARKLLVAQQQGWLPQDQVDRTLWDMVDLIARARRDVTSGLQDQQVSPELLEQCRQSFARSTDEIADHIDQYPWETLSSSAGDSVQPSWREDFLRFRKEVAEPAQAIVEKVAETTSAQDELAGQLLGLCESAKPFEQMLAQALDAYGSQLAASGNPSITSALGLFDQTSRWRRAEGDLLAPASGLLPQLARTHEIELIAVSGSEAETVWDQKSVHEPPTELGIEPLGQATDLSTGIADAMTETLNPSSSPDQPSETAARTAVVLVTDGRHNAGQSPVQTARVMGGQKVPIFTVGFGGRREPPDLAVLEVQHPDMVFQKDRIRGTVVLKDQMPPGRSFVLQIGHGNEVLWQQQMTTQNVSLRRIDFEFSIDDLVEQLRTRFDAQVRHHALPLSLQASIPVLDGETETSNNESTMRFTAITQSYKLLLIDGRSRWETRYLRNLFQRDEQWHIDTILVGPATDQATLPRGAEPNMFPTDRAALFEYDLIVFGEVPPGTLADYELGWVREFVENRGGGLIFIDGQRGELRQQNEEILKPLMPVSWMPGPVDSAPSRLQLTETGLNQSALMLESSSLANERFWQELPAPHRIVPVEALPGTEVFVEAHVERTKLPVLVTRSFGAGRVLYFAFDETWRWRYKVADRYHQRFWNQVAKWVMQRPFAVSDEYVSLDSGPPSYQNGQPAEIRVRLRGVDGKPVSDATVDALLWQDGRIVSTVTLVPDDAANGLYHGRTSPLTQGEYEVSVRASGFSEEAMKARTGFVVLPPDSGEMRQVACNEDLLQEMALASGGQFLREEEIGRLPELLEPLSSGHVVESETLLWQSYWWFAAIVILLTIEWTLRKRAGLL